MKRQTFNEKLERQAQNGTEWLYGAVEKDLAAVPPPVRDQYLPEGVLQFNILMDTEGCASRGFNNILETKLDYFYDHGMLPELKQWCDDNGYRVDGKFRINDAFLEILSGTTRQGNSMKAPLDTLRKVGAIPAYMLPLEPEMTWEQYMDPSRITDEHKKLGQEFLRRFTLNYEQVPLSRFTEALQDDLLDVALAAWPDPENGVYPRMDGPFNHVVARFNNEIDVFDNYDPFVKRLAKDYIFFDWGYSLSITAQNPNPEERANIIVQVFNTLLSFNLAAYFPAWLTLFLKPTTPSTPPQKPTLPPAEPVPAPAPTSKYQWDTKANIRHSIRVICDEEGLSVQDKNELCATIQAESQFVLTAKRENIKDEKVWSTDWGLCQWNDYYHAVEISPTEAVKNPEKAVRLMCSYWKNGEPAKKQWVAYSTGAYKKYL